MTQPIFGRTRVTGPERGVHTLIDSDFRLGNDRQ